MVELQNYKANGGAYTRGNMFPSGKYPELLRIWLKTMTERMTIMILIAAAMDPYKVYAA